MGRKNTILKETKQNLLLLFEKAHWFGIGSRNLEVNQTQKLALFWKHFDTDTHLRLVNLTVLLGKINSCFLAGHCMVMRSMWKALGAAKLETLKHLMNEHLLLSIILLTSEYRLLSTGIPGTPQKPFLVPNSTEWRLNSSSMPSLQGVAVLSYYPNNGHSVTWRKEVGS